MNKAITEGLALMPPPFSDGLDVWSSQDGTPGSDTYAISGNGAYVPADANFAGCLELYKTESVQKVRYMGQTPVLPGCYLRVTARVKAISGALPAVRIAGWAGRADGSHLPGVTETGPATQLETYGEVVEVSAIIGTGLRGGVDMVWTGAAYGHLGIDLTGPDGGVVRLDDIEVEDITRVFLRDLMAIVDVRDYGARGDGTTDDSAAFEAADAAANGRTVHVPAGTYRLAQDVTLENRASFEGTITQPPERRFILQRNFDYATYLTAFGDEALAFRKAWQALLNFSDHESLDLGGRRITLFEPLDMQAAEPSRTRFEQRRAIRNGQFLAASTGDWDDLVVTSEATYSAASPQTLTGVAQAASIPVGSLVTGNGVGREVYVRAVDAARNEITLSTELFDAEGTQVFTFTRFRYLLDFSGYEALSLLVLDDIEFQCAGHASGIMLPPDGLSFHLRDCFVTRPRDRGITSPGRGCQGLMVDRCQLLSDESPLKVEDRRSIGLNANSNDVKLRDCRVVHFKHFCVLGGTGNVIVGNHWFHGDGQPDGVRKGGIVLTTPNVASLITGNYIDNNFIEWTNEHSATPALGQQFSFGGLTVSGNIFIAIDVAPWFNWLVIKPHGPGHFIHGLSVTGNAFRTFGGYIDRVEGIDTTYADLDFDRMRNVEFRGNTYHGVTDETFNPVSIVHDQGTADRLWLADARPYLPFDGRPRTVEAVTPVGRIRDGAGGYVYEAPHVEPDWDPSTRRFRMVWSQPAKGQVRCMVRMDNPI